MLAPAGRQHMIDTIRNHEIPMVVNTVEQKAVPSQARALFAPRVVTYAIVTGAQTPIEGMRQLPELKVDDLQGLDKALN